MSDTLGMSRKYSLYYGIWLIMRIFIITQWFPPEHAPIGQMMLELAAGLVKRGHKVTVFTGFPNHPSGKVFSGYYRQLVQKEWINGVDIRRVFLFTSPKRTFFRRILTSLTFIFMAFWTALLHGRCDVIISVLQPLTVGIFVPVLAKIKRARLVFNLQDIHPDALIELGIIQNNTLISFLHLIEMFAYRRADKIAVICDSFKEHIISKGISADKVEVIENWVNPDEIKPCNRLNRFREKYGIASDDNVTLFSGTVGYISGAEIIIETAYKLRNEAGMVFLIVGDGPVLHKLKNECKKRNLQNVRYMPFQKREALNDIQATADISLVTMHSDKGKFSVPSKVLTYMAAARPIIASVDLDSPTAEQIAKADCGIVIPAGDADALANAIMTLRNSENLRSRFGRNGREYIEKYLNADSAVEKYETLLKSIVEAKC
jgi:colanic acid biosynthesis glycosyl transferase WcaI